MKLHGRILQPIKNAAVKCHYLGIHGWREIIDKNSFNESLTFWGVEIRLENDFLKM